jgi:CDP-archaeol synthase
VLAEALVEKSGLSRGYFSPEDVLLNRVSPFCNVQWGQPQGRFAKRQTLCFVRMSIWQIEGNKDACIGVGTQNRPRSSISNFAPERTRPPNICLRNAAKSGVRTRFLGVFCGTIRAIKRSRSRSSTVFPALSKALSLRVSRSWRIFTLGTNQLWHILCHVVKKLSFHKFEANSKRMQSELRPHDDRDQIFPVEWRMHFWLVTKLLILLTLANGTPVITKDILGERFASPIDAHAKFVDGRPLFGCSKTFRGILLSILVTSAFAPLVALSWRVGALVASVAMAGDLFSSFLKRRINLRAGDRATGLDQIPESLFPLLICRSVLPLAAADIVAGVAIFFHPSVASFLPSPPSRPALLIQQRCEASWDAGKLDRLK